MIGMIAEGGFIMRKGIICTLFMAAVAAAQPVTPADTIKEGLAASANLIRITQSATFDETLGVKNCRIICEAGVSLTWTQPVSGIEAMGGVIIEGCQIRGSGIVAGAAVDGDGPHGIFTRGSTGLELRGVTVSNWSGDGLCLGVARTADRAPTTNIYVSWSTFHTNGRNAVSVVCAANPNHNPRPMFEYCKFVGSKGNPGAGVDIEPMVHKIDGVIVKQDTIHNVRFTDCESYGNEGYPYIVQVAPLTAAAPPISVEFIRCSGRTDTRQTVIWVNGFQPTQSVPIGYVEWEGMLFGVKP
jgi:hypothetical protein